MDKRYLSLILAAAAAAALPAQSSLPAPAASIVELEDFLFVQNPRGPGAQEGVYVMWIPQLVQKYCLDKTSQQCIDLDYCMRTKTRKTSRCQNPSVDVAELPFYPPGMRPSRVIGVTYFPAAPIKGLNTLLKYVESKPKETFDHLSATTRFKAKIKLIRSSDDDQYELLEVLALPPL